MLHHRFHNSFSARALVTRFFPYLFLAGIVGLLFVTNYTPGTWLTGWDNLHPEFDFKTNIIDRSIFSTWQEYQGLGVRAGNAHAADLLRQLGLWFISLIFPTSLLRYIYHFFALYIGTVGIYELCRRVIFHHRSTSLIVATFYLLNLGTMQYFYVPYEAFSHFYASLPWLLLSILLYLQTTTKKRLVLVIFCSILAIPMNYIPTLFVVYSGILGIIVLWAAVQKKIRSALIVLAVTLCINAYWLLPFMDFVRNGTSFVSEVTINRMFTEEAFLRNQKFGTVHDVPLMRGFLFDTTDLVDTSGTNHYMMQPWMTFLESPTISFLYYIIFIAIILGYCTAILKKSTYSILFITLFAISLFALFNDNPPTGVFFKLFQDYLPFFKQIFRFPFTKFIPLAALTYAIGLGYSYYYISSVLHKKKFASASIFGLICGTLVILNTPSFSGHFIYSHMRVAIPQEYFSLFEFFQSQPFHRRIANLPQPTFWGWTTYDWGYRGSGFPWYGIPQPILDRAFDVWNTENEVYYQRLSNALYVEQTAGAVADVLYSYNVGFVWIDGRVSIPHQPKLQFIDETQRILDNDPRFEKVFSEGSQSVYSFTPVVRSLYSVEKTTTDIPVFPNDELTRKHVSQLDINALPSSLTLTSTLSAGTLQIPAVAPDKNTPYLVNLQPGKVNLTPQLPKLKIGTAELVDIVPTTTIPINSSENSIWMINDTLLSPDTSTTALLHPYGNDIYSISRESTTPTDISSKFFSLPAVNCAMDNQYSRSIFGSHVVSSQEILLYGNESKPCIYARLSDVVSPSFNTTTELSAITISYDFLARDNEVVHLCLSKEGETSCFFTDTSTESESLSDGYSRRTVTIPLYKQSLNKTWLKLEVLTKAGLVFDEVQLRNVNITQFTTISEQLSFDIPRYPVRNIQIAENETISIELNDTFVKPIIITPLEFSMTNRNCFALGTGIHQQQLLHDPLVGFYIDFRAKNASSCDYTLIQNKLIQQGAIVQVMSKNIQGRPLRFAIKTDPPGNYLLQDFLSGGSDWNTDAFILPSFSTDTLTPYAMEIDNYAVGIEIRHNALANLTLWPIPLDWLTSIRLTPTKPTASRTIAGQDTYVEITASNPTWYTFSLPETAHTIVLPQMFDPSWKAYTIECTGNNVQCAMKKGLPFLFGKELKNHVLVNNWANGWEIAPATTACTISSETCKPYISIFFYPQLLQWVGFSLVLVPLLGMFVFMPPKRHN